ncbi:serine hydrolase domain-containing protein [Nonomuraea sp. NPDC048826]|uniref:serine hydrolase domain-containing protein n=1 Tax=Nonomuraea sp. NPDC048826 TaxID=3364347 RepID=UPI00371AEEDD
MEIAERLDAVLSAGQARNVHGVVVVERGERVAERYGAGEDFRLNESLGHVTFDADTPHDLRSITKSVVGLLYGIALGDGLVPDPRARLLEPFPEHRDLAEDPARAALTVEHALTMTLGLAWDESAPYTSTANSEIAMEYAPDRYRYVLERPIVEEPGTRWAYCGGATALLGKIIARGAGRPLDEYAARVLFEPLGIGGFDWTRGADGAPLAAAGLRLRPRDLAAIGGLLLRRGDGVVPEKWLEEMLRPRVPISGERHYGYHWYVDTGEPAAVMATGNGGQCLLVVPSRELVVAVTAGAYDASDRAGTAAVLDAVLRGRAG